MAIQQQQLSSAIQRQQAKGAKVGTPSRRRVGTPGALRTAVEAESALAFGGKDTTSTTGVGGLNV